MPIGSSASGFNLTVPAAVIMRARGAFKKAPGTAASIAPTQSAIGIAGKMLCTRRPAIPLRNVARKTTPPLKLLD